MLKKIPEDGYRDIFNKTTSTILVMSTNAPFYTILDVNEAYLNATNSTREELVGKSVFAAFPANPTDEVSKNIERTVFSFEQAITTKKAHTMYNYRYDIPIRGTNEFEERYWTTTNTPILDENGEVSYFIHSPENVTELFKLAQREKAGIEALKNQRRQLYSTFMQAPVGIAIFKGPNYITELINPPLCEIYGKTVDEMIGKNAFEVLSHTKGLGFEQLVDSVRTTGVPFKGFGLAAPLVRNGKLETAYLNFVYEPFREDDGTISGVIAVATEVTEQVNAKIQLEEAEERARLAVDAVDLGTFDLNLETDEMITSVAFANIFGFEKPVRRDEYVKVFHPDDLELRTNAHKQAVIDGKLFYEARVIWPNQSIRWTRVEGKVYYNAEGKAVRILGTLLDVTEQRILQQQKDNFIGIASHELKTPVTSIKAYTQVVERMLIKKGDIKEAEMVARMDKQLNRLTALIADLLDVTKINSGRMQFNNCEFDFNKLVKELIEDLQPTTERHKLIEELTPMEHIFGDKERIGQVITNLITNAIKYSPHGDKIIIRSSVLDNELTFCVEDFGIGIKKSHLTRVFEQFYRVSGDNAQHTFPGLGLGLYISSEIIKREGGRIWVTSEEGQGSKFCFTLPVARHKSNTIVAHTA